MTSYRYFAGWVPNPFGARVDDSPHLLPAAHHHGRHVVERVGQHRLDPIGQRGVPRSRTREHHVAALDVRGDVLEPVLLEARLERGHLDQVLPADVDPAQEGDVGRHAGMYSSPSDRPPMTADQRLTARSAPPRRRAGRRGGRSPPVACAHPAPTPERRPAERPHPRRDHDHDEHLPVSSATPTTQGRSRGRNVPTAASAKSHAFGLTHWNVSPCHRVGGCFDARSAEASAPQDQVGDEQEIRRAHHLESELDVRDGLDQRPEARPRPRRAAAPCRGPSRRRTGGCARSRTACPTPRAPRCSAPATPFRRTRTRGRHERLMRRTHAPTWCHPRTTEHGGLVRSSRLG